MADKWTSKADHDCFNDANRDQHADYWRDRGIDISKYGGGGGGSDDHCPAGVCTPSRQGGEPITGRNQGNDAMGHLQPVHTGFFRWPWSSPGPVEVTEEFQQVERRRGG